MENLHSDLIQKMTNTGIIPVFNHQDISVVKEVLDACYKGGIRVFEFTNRSKNSIEIFRELKEYAAKYPDLFLGIGTIFTVVEADKFLEIGADFIVSPAYIEEVARYCYGQGAFWIPGCGTMTEIHQAKKMGAILIKVFPGNVLGPEFVTAAKSVFPDIHFMPTGGVEPTQQNLSAWYNAGVTCVGMGSQLFKKDWVEEKAYDRICEEVEKTIQLIRSFK
ncbi:bifunctional 4-hydroxy-2-oxoglutarate aldolase/2-dehydro-3-deoxy-phosphogluconate aldolase [Algoriphagus aestuarii]|nr:bifunctional 4-hydroxy-2-oxoglutarate aldolase/2-dehydro-3-deoxy-phosphogluconate aldolase [Algoriphagus aestuarii]